MVVSSATKAPAIGNDEAAASPQPLPPIVNAVAFASGSIQSSSQQDVLHWASQQLRGSGIDSHARDVRILLRHVLGCTEEDLAGGRADLISADHVPTLQGLILRRQQGEPVAYITGRKEFMGLEFAVDRRVLIPRPETELLVEKALDLFGCESSNGRHSLSPPTCHGVPQPLIADIGTGSGAIAVSIAKALPQATVYATDMSADALASAQRNGVAHGVSDRLVLLQGSYLQALPESVHVIVCNPPYIPLGDIPGLDPDVRDYEPHLALSGGKDGLDAFRAIFPDLPSYLLTGGIALFEIGFDLAARLTALARDQLPGARVDIYRDLAGFDRILRISQVESAQQGNGG